MNNSIVNYLKICLSVLLMVSCTKHKPDLKLEYKSNIDSLINKIIPLKSQISELIYDTTVSDQGYYDENGKYKIDTNINVIDKRNVFKFQTRNGHLAYLYLDSALILVMKCDETVSIDTIFSSIGSIYPVVNLYFAKKFKFGKENYFLYNLVWSGTGFSNENYLFHVDSTNCKIDTVDFKDGYSVYKKFLKKDQGIWKGESFEFGDNTITTGVGIWNKSDANCCPTGGSISGEYKIIKSNNRYLLVPDSSRFEYYEPDKEDLFLY